jgi:hypothetical protein
MLATAAAAIVFRWLVGWLLPPSGVDESRLLPVVFPEAYGYVEKGGAPPHYKAITPDSRGGPSVLGAVFRSTEVSEAPRGYAGPVPLLVGMGIDGTITGVRILEHHETPAYVVDVEKPEFLQQFVGRTLADPIRLEEDIDGVTRATVTAKAVADGVRLSSRAVGREVMGLPVPREQEAPWSAPWPDIAALALLCVLACATLGGRGRALRWLPFLLGLALLGYRQGVYLSTTTAANILLWRWPSLKDHLFWYILVAFGLTVAAAWRNVYCARMCPFGALQELLHFFCPRSLRSSPEEDLQARRLRYVFLWLVVLAVFLFGRTEAANYEPFSTAFDFKGGTLRWVFLGTVLFFAAVRHRFWCRYFCPTGLWLQILGRMRSANPFD